MTIHAPVPDYAAARASMVDTQLRPEGVNYPPIAEAMAAVQREEFVADDARALAYIDRTVPIGDGRLMSAPAVLGKLLTEMTPLPGERALVVGCGTGYSAAVLKSMGLEVIGVESSRILAGAARKHGIDVVEGALQEGWKKAAPYQLILIDGAVEYIPDAIVAQLTDHGRLGVALIDKGICRLAVGRKAGKEGFGLYTMADAGAAALPGFAKPRTFTF
jgi:protein-L-isoaspartate(D-aspartate) O-methyltransferase